MIKTAIFVEGQTELIFVRELLLRIFEHQNIHLECYTLFSKGKFHPTEYPFTPEVEVKYYFQIINVGSDAMVLSSILRREALLWNSGFQKIIGLRDMYSETYRKIVKNRKISEEINQKFKEGTQETIDKNAQYPDRIIHIFAIMEVEAWFLGLYTAFEGLDEKLTSEYIQEKLNFNLAEINPETSFFHPAKQVGEIYNLAGKKYDKKKGDVSAIVSYITKDDYNLLYLDENKCASYSAFYDSIPKEDEAID